MDTPPRLSIATEQALLALGAPDATPRIRAALHGLELRPYLARVYGYDVGEPALPPAATRLMRSRRRVGFRAALARHLDGRPA